MNTKHFPMSKASFGLSLFILSGITVANSAFASEAYFPHRRAQEMIAPVLNHPIASLQMANGPTDRADVVDPHERARLLMHDDRWPTTYADRGSASQGNGPVEADPQRRARSMIVGKTD